MKMSMQHCGSLKEEALNPCLEMSGITEDLYEEELEGQVGGLMIGQRSEISDNSLCQSKGGPREHSVFKGLHLVLCCWGNKY